MTVIDHWMRLLHTARKSSHGLYLPETRPLLVLNVARNLAVWMNQHVFLWSKESVRITNVEGQLSCNGRLHKNLSRSVPPLHALRLLDSNNIHVCVCDCTFSGKWMQNFLVSASVHHRIIPLKQQNLFDIFSNYLCSHWMKWTSYPTWTNHFVSLRFCHADSLTLCPPPTRLLWAARHHMRERVRPLRECLIMFLINPLLTQQASNPQFPNSFMFIYLFWDTPWYIIKTIEFVTKAHNKSTWSPWSKNHYDDEMFPSHIYVCVWMHFLKLMQSFLASPSSASHSPFVIFIYWRQLLGFKLIQE